jgi:hypothetical protein
MLPRILRILLGLSSLWWSQSLSGTAYQLRDEATGGHDVGITHGPQVDAAPQALEWNQKFLDEITDRAADGDPNTDDLPEPFVPPQPQKKSGNFFDEVIEQDARERKAREQKEKQRRQPQKGDANFFGEDPAVFVKRPENKAKLDEASSTSQWSEAARYIGYFLILSGLFPGLWELVGGRKPKSEGETNDTLATAHAAPRDEPASTPPVVETPAGDAGQTASVVDESRPVHTPPSS